MVRVICGNKSGFCLVARPELLLRSGFSLCSSFAKFAFKVFNFLSVFNCLIISGISIESLLDSSLELDLDFEAEWSIGGSAVVP